MPRKSSSAQLPREDLGLTAFREAPEEQGLSLEKLSAAFAEMCAGRHDPYERVAEPPVSPGLEVAAQVAAEEGVEAACEVTPRTIVEAMLFVGHPHNEPLLAERVAALMRGVRPAEIGEVVAELNQQYAANQCPYTIAGVGAGYRLVLREEFAPVRDRLLGRGREVRLSPAAIEVLALVAYHEPQSAEEIAQARGRPSGSLLALLVRRGLLKVERTTDEARKRLYTTTPRFLALFRLESLADLPRGQDLEQR